MSSSNCCFVTCIQVSQEKSQVWYKSNPLQLYSGSDKWIQGIRSDQVPEELWTEVHDIAQETRIKTIPKKKKCKKEKWLSKEVLQRAVNRREVKSMGEKERYTHLNAELQRIPRRDKKAFLHDQCKEIEGNNNMGKTRDLFKKIRDTKGTFHANGYNKEQKWYGLKRSRKY